MRREHDADEKRVASHPTARSNGGSLDAPARRRPPHEPNRSTCSRGAGTARRAPSSSSCPKPRRPKEVRTGLVDELQRDFKLLAIRVETAADFATIAQAIQQHHPVALVLINDPTVAAYREFQHQVGGDPFPSCRGRDGVVLPR